MRPDSVVSLAPLFDDDLRFLEAIEDFTVQKLVAIWDFDKVRHAEVLPLIKS
jgi:hypothetical protein